MLKIYVLFFGKKILLMEQVRFKFLDLANNIELEMKLKYFGKFYIHTQNQFFDTFPLE